MVQQSRPSRGSSSSRTNGGRFATTASRNHEVQQQKAGASQQRASSHHTRLHHHHGTSIPNSSDDDADEGFADDGPPAKKRKLSIRHRQTTLDSFTTRQQQRAEELVKPPSKISVLQPHGRLQETVNGVRTTLDAGEDDVADEVRSAERLPQSKSKSKPVANHNGTVEKEKKEEKRTLRSQDDGPRLKSELAVYFPNYEDIVLGVEKEEEFVTVDSTLYITDDTAKAQPSPNSTLSPQKGRTNGTTNGIPTTPQQRNSSINTEYNGCAPIDLSPLARNTPSHPADPLSDAHFFTSHRRAERREKQLRNIERERAMHEKVQLERLLDGLLGHDWLRVLGITGITDGEAKKYEPKREFFVGEVRALVGKFREWKEEERRQRLEREAAREAEEEEEEEEESEGSVEPPSSEMNASASRQLQQETMNSVRSGFKIRLGKRKDPTAASAATPTPGSTMRPPPLPQIHPPPFAPPAPIHLEPITSFYTKRHLRDAALSKTRHAGRNTLAFGHPIPDMTDFSDGWLGEEWREFELPEEYVTEDALRASARERRRRKRGAVADAGGGGG